MRRVEIQTGVWPDGVVAMDGGGDDRLRRREVGKERVEVELVFQDPVDAFGHGVLIAVGTVGHAREHPRGVQGRAVRVTAVLRAAVRVMDHAGTVAEGLLGHGEGLQGSVMREVAAEVPADDVARAEIRDEEEIREGAARQRQVRDVADDDLAGRRDGRRRQQIRRWSIAMPRIGRLRLPPLPWHQLPVRAQEREEVVASHMDALRRQGLVQFARAEPRLIGAAHRDIAEH